MDKRLTGEQEHQSCGTNRFIVEKQELSEDDRKSEMTMNDDKKSENDKNDEYKRKKAHLASGQSRSLQCNLAVQEE